MKPENAQQLQSLLTYHVINAAAPLSKVEGTKGPVQTASGAKVEVDGSATPIKFNDADVTAMSTTTNGSIYVVDKVLSPDKLAAEAPPPATPGQPAAAQVASTAPPSGTMNPGAQVASRATGERPTRERTVRQRRRRAGLRDHAGRRLGPYGYGSDRQRAGSRHAPEPRSVRPAAQPRGIRATQGGGN